MADSVMVADDVALLSEALLVAPDCVSDRVGCVREPVAPVNVFVAVSAGVIVSVRVGESEALGDALLEESDWVSVALDDEEGVAVSAGVNVLVVDCERLRDELALGVAVSGGVMVAVVVPEADPPVLEADEVTSDFVGLAVPPVADAVGTVRLSVAPVAEAVGVSAGVMVRVSVPDPVGLVPESDLVSEPSLFVSVADPVGCVGDADVVGVSAGVIVLDSVADSDGVLDADRLAVSAGVMVLVVVPEGVARVKDCE